MPTAWSHPNWPLDRLPAGLGRKSPWGSALLGVGLFSLLGLPFTLGFAGHWRLLTAVAELANGGSIPWWLPALALLGLGLGAAGVLRLLAALFAPVDDALQNANAQLWQQGVVGLVLLVSLWLALNPGWITAVATALAPLIN